MIKTQKSENVGNWFIKKFWSQFLHSCHYMGFDWSKNNNKKLQSYFIIWRCHHEINLVPWRLWKWAQHKNANLFCQNNMNCIPYWLEVSMYSGLPFRVCWDLQLQNLGKIFLRLSQRGVRCYTKASWVKAELLVHIWFLKGTGSWVGKQLLKCPDWTYNGVRGNKKLIHGVRVSELLWIRVVCFCNRG